MKRKLARFGVLLLALAGIVATMVPSAQATTRKTITFIGDANLSAGLQYPCTTNPPTTACTNSTVTTKPGPKPTTTIANNTPGSSARTANFTFSSAVCTKTSTSAGKTGTANKNGADPCGITASGTVTGYCGFSTGTGVATITNLSGTKTSTTMGFKFTGTGGVLHVTGGNPVENIIGEGRADPTPFTGSCAQAGATWFTITGVLEYKKCTAGNPAPCV